MNITCRTTDEVWRVVTDALEKHRRERGPMLGESMPATVITSERYDELWKAAGAKARELIGQHKDRRGDGRSAALTGWDGREVSTLVSIGLNDGTDLVYRVCAYTYGSRRDRIEVGVDGPWLDNHDRFWAKEYADRSNAVVIGHEHYRIQPDLASGEPHHCAGFGGSLFRIRRHGSNEVLETRNLWHQGTIPPSWRDRLPDDAEFVKAAPLVAAEDVTR